MAKGVVTMERLRFYLKDLAERYLEHARSGLYTYCAPASFEHFARQLPEMLEKHGAVEEADEVIVLETTVPLDVQNADALRDAQSLYVLRFALGLAERESDAGQYAARYRKVARDEEPPVGALWFIETLDEAKQRIIIKRWKTGYLDSRD